MDITGREIGTPTLVLSGQNIEEQVEQETQHVVGKLMDHVTSSKVGVHCSQS